MRNALAVLLMLIVASIALSQTSKPSGTGTIIGVVVNALGQPVASCIVTAQENAEKMRFGVQGTTDKDGRFKLEKVVEGDYNVNVRSSDTRGKALKSASVVAGKTTDLGKLVLK